MQYRKSTLFASASLVATSMAAYIPSEPWSTLTPDAAAPSGATTDYTKTFGIAVQPITTGSYASSATASASSASASATALKRRDVVSQIGDGQIQATTSTAAATSTAQVVSQIGDGQIQATTSTATTSSAAKTSTAQVVSQIGDGQIQATTSTAAAASTAEVVSQIGDGQIQATTSTGTTVTSTAAAVSQITDGQIQATTTTSDESSSTSSSTEATSASSDDDEDTDSESVACLTDSSLAMTLSGSILTDSAGRIGSIVANRQFQFDGPPPQAGAIYAAGWSVTSEGNLAIGDNDVFYQCLSGTFYNLYDESIGAQCTPIHLEVVDLVSC